MDRTYRIFHNPTFADDDEEFLDDDEFIDAEEFTDEPDVFLDASETSFAVGTSTAAWVLIGPTWVARRPPLF